jgi:predicted glutamine amidotransferase
MCRFVLYLGKPVTISSLFVEPAHSLIRQSVHADEREEPLNGDGFGVAWYAPEFSPEPALFRSISPAWNNRNLLELSRVTRSGCILAHVRAATQALEISEPNCHPFTIGRFSFMHNGDLGGFAAARKAIIERLPSSLFERVRGTTDSEHLFGLIVSKLAQTQDETSDHLASALMEGVREAIALSGTHRPGEHSYLNLVLSNGRSAVACRYTTDLPDGADSLYLNWGKRYVCEDGVCRMLDADEASGSVIVASEPLSEEPGWHAVPTNHLVLIDGSRQPRVIPWPE